MLQKNIVFVLAVIILLLVPAYPVTAAEPVPTVVSVQAEKGQEQDEFIFKATVAGVRPGDSQYLVLLQLAERSGEYKDSDEKLFTPMVCNNASMAWTATRTVDRFGRDKTRRFRVVLRDKVSGAIVAAGQDEILRQPGKEPAITRQEVLDFLSLMSKEYTAKNYRGFMNLVSQDFAGDDFVLSNALRKDFLLLNNIDISFTVTGVTANAKFATIQANYRRSVTPTQSGQRLNDSGLTELSLYKEKGKLKLYSMKKPLLFGLANGGAAATGTVIAGQNKNVIQIKKDGTVVVGPVVSISPAMKTLVLAGRHVTEGTFTVEYLKIADGSKVASDELFNPPGDIGLIEYSNRQVNLYCGWQKMAATDINSVKSVPSSGYNASGSFDFSTVGTAVFALHLSNGKYSVVEVTNWSAWQTVDIYGVPVDNWSATILYKYQTDGTLNF